MAKRSQAEQNTRKKWWNAGHALEGRNSTKPENQGLSHREQLAMETENSRPWGQSLAHSTVTTRARRKSNGPWPDNH